MYFAFMANKTRFIADKQPKREKKVELDLNLRQKLHGSKCAADCSKALTALQ